MIRAAAISRESSRGRSRVRRSAGDTRALLAALTAALLLAACASTPPHYPSQTAEARIGKPLFNLEMRWSTPAGLHEVNGAHVATWRFNQYNYAGCSVTVRTDREGIIQEVTWTKGCGPKRAKGGAKR